MALIHSSAGRSHVYMCKQSHAERASHLPQEGYIGDWPGLRQGSPARTGRPCIWIGRLSTGLAPVTGGRLASGVLADTAGSQSGPRPAGRQE